MCFAIVRVKYRTDGTVTLNEVADTETLEQKLELLRAANGVEKIEVFKRESTLRRVEIWETQSPELSE